MFEFQKLSQTYTKVGYIILRSNNLLFLIGLFLLFSGFRVSAQEDRLVSLPVKTFNDSITTTEVPINILSDSNTPDSVQVDTIKTNQSVLQDNIKYKAKGYVRLSKKENKIYLYDEAEIYYQDTELKAGTIIMDYTKNEVYAGRLKDTVTGAYSQLPYFKQGNNLVIPDSIRFNFDTKKALTWNSRTEQQANVGSVGAVGIGGGSDAMKILAEKTKKENDSVYFLRNARLTTSKDTLDPDYYIKLYKAKFVPGKKIITGPANMFLVDVPTPIGLPFAYFPLSNQRTGGFIFPTFGNDPDRGYFLQNIGYYIPVSEYADLNFTGSYYTNGSYDFRLQSVYTQRYKFKGNISFEFQNIINSQRGFDDYSRRSQYSIRISHAQDQKANPNSRLQASVNLGSSEFFQNSLNQRNRDNALTNTLSSSISYTKTFPEYPSVNTSISVNHSQNSNTGIINMTLPTFQASMERIFPLAKRDGIKKGIFQNINFQYDVNARNEITTNEDEFFTKEMFEDARLGARHRIPIGTNFKVAKYFSVSLNSSYEDIWAFETIQRDYDAELDAVVTDTIAGFDRFNKYNFSTSIGTTLYGTVNFGEDKKIQAIRHVVRPSISYGYTPSFEQFYESYIDGDGQEVQYTPFETSLYGRPSLNKSNSMSFSLQNTLEAKVRDKDSTKLEPKKVAILSNLTLSASYNFNADSLKLSTIRMSGATQIIEKLPINFNATFDPYAIDANGTRINTFNIKNGGGLARLTSASLNTNFKIDGDTFRKKKDRSKNEEQEDDVTYGDNPFALGNQFGNDAYDSGPNTSRRGHDDDIENPIYATKNPWSANFRYAVTYNNSNRQNQVTNHSLMFSGNVQLSPRWNVRYNSGYDFRNKGFTDTRFVFERNLKSFDLRFDWTPFGRNKRWYFFIGISSSILQDLKWENRSQPIRR